MHNKVVCAGTLIMDIFNDPVTKAPGPNEGVATRIHSYPGGNAFNVVKDLVHLCFTPEDITCLGAVGDDSFGKLFIDELVLLGVNNDIYRAEGTTTSKIIMLKVHNEEPRYYLDLAANSQLSADFIVAKIQSIQPSVFYTGETGNLSAVLPHFTRVLQTAKKYRCLTIVDTTTPENED